MSTNGFPNRSPIAHRRAALGLKACPLCGAVNAPDNDECFVCLWHGQFDQDPALVEQALSELLDVCPQLAETMQDQSKRASRMAQGLARLRRALKL